MKKILLSAVAVLAFAACDKKVEKTETTIKDTVSVETPAPAETTTTTTDSEVKTETEGTSVSVSNDGIDVSTKNGEKTTKVEIDAKK